MKIASIELISEIYQHSNANSLDIVKVLGYECIVKRGEFEIGEKILFIFPDSVLPMSDWSIPFKAKSNRVRAIKLRGKWSQGIVLQLTSVNINSNLKVGIEVSQALNIKKYEPPAPQDLSAKGFLPFNIPKTDEERWQSLDIVPYGEIVDITLKRDGQSSSFYCKLNEDKTTEIGVCGRTLELKLDSSNNYTNNAKNHNILAKLEKYCLANNVSLCLRGESFGSNIQKFEVNPDSGGELKLNLFSTWLIDEKRYARKGDKYYIFNIAPELDLPTVPIIEKDVILIPELIKKYDEELELLNGKNFEGVVINGKNFSFKVISKYYDSLK